MSEANGEDLIRYDVMVQQALIGVVRKVLQDAARHGLPGDHHFYISFRTDAPGARVSTRLKDKHPDEMTIVLQHQFWDLLVTEHAFEVGLSFGGVPERLLVPFEAMTGFFDPSVQFGLKFAVDEAFADNDAGHDELDDRTARGTLDKIDAIEKKPGAGGSVPSLSAKPEPPAEAPAKKPRKSKKDAPAPDHESPETPAASSGEVVSLEAFRKKK